VVVPYGLICGVYIAVAICGIIGCAIGIIGCIIGCAIAMPGYPVVVWDDVVVVVVVEEEQHVPGCIIGCATAMPG